MIWFVRPELLGLMIPVIAALVYFGRAEHRITMLLRAAAAAAIIAVIAGPYRETTSEGRGVVFVVDRSNSMPAESRAEAVELINLAMEQREEGDTVRVVVFGEGSGVESQDTGDARGFDAFTREIGADGSDMAAGLNTALAMIPPGTAGSIVLMSDGDVSDAPGVDAAALEAASRRVRIDVREVGRPATTDVAIERVELPEIIDVAEPFFVTAWVQSDAPRTRTVRLLRGNTVIATERVELPRGRTRMRFRERVDQAGVQPFTVELLSEGEPDRVPENDRALAAVRVTGPRPVAIVNHDGSVDALVAALRDAGVPALPLEPTQLPRSVAGLESFRAVVIENVSAARLGLDRMRALRAWVQDHGGGLALTGGAASFGSGGYFRSPLDELLPVSMELREEHRKLAVALSVTLDRSGSMSAGVTGGGTKMDLANAGTAEALTLLSPADSASVIAVDSSPHVIVPQSPISDLASMVSKVRGIRSQGGGIFTATALQASARELRTAPQATRHVILFADAADAEEQVTTPAAIDLLRSLGSTLSVIALGTKADPDATFLIDCAKRGGGEVYFTTSPQDLPKLFAMDTQAMARSTFVEEATAVQARSDLMGLGEWSRPQFPVVGGYNLTYLRPGAQLGAVTKDSYDAPIFAFHQRGLGRVAAFTAQIGGSTGSSVTSWDGFSSFAVTLTRWLGGVETPEGVFASVTRDGRDAVLSVEFDETYKGDPGSTLKATVTGDGGAGRTVTLERAGPGRFVGRTGLRSGEVAVTTLSVAAPGSDGESETAVPLAPITLPYSPEYERPADPRAGRRRLRRIAARTGGESAVSAADVFRGERRGRRWRLLTAEFVVLGLLLLVLEIAGRRLHLWSSLSRRAGTLLKGAGEAARSAGPGTKRRGGPASQEETGPASGPAAEPGKPTSTSDAMRPAPGTSEPPKAGNDTPGGLGEALQRARANSRDRLGE